MKPIKGLWEQITAFEDLYAAYRSAVKGKRFRKEVLAFSDNLEASLFDLQRDLLQGTYEVGGYALKLDISKYFYRINHDVLMSMLRRWFADRELLDLLERIIRSAVPFGLPAGASPGEADRIYGVGMPIGNLISQMFANLYLKRGSIHKA